jgi:GntR family transcriptional regulator / MocR family aminotransferase
MSRPLSTPVVADAAALALSIDRRRGEPIAVQLGHQLREMILSGRMPRLARLPSSRALALDLGISRATVVHAYEQLASEGYVEGRHGAGMFVSSALPEQVLQMGIAKSKTLVTPPQGLTAQPQAPRARPFQLGAIDPELFPFKEWARLLQRAWRVPSRSLLVHADPFGWPDLRTAIGRHLLQWRGIACDTSRIVITSGTADAVELIAHLAFPPGMQVLVEDPGYPSLRYALQRRGVSTVPVAVDDDGFDLSRAPRHRDTRGAIVTPSRQFPLGAVLPVARRLALLEWATQVEATIVEDDFDSEYRYAGTPLPALTSLDANERSIYVGSFSKVLLPTLRLGFVVLPVRLIAAAWDHLRQRGAMASLIAQPALAELMLSGVYATHIRRTRRLYARRMAALMAERDLFEGLLSLVPTTAGMHVVAEVSARLSRRHSDREIAATLREAGIVTSPLSDYYAAVPAQRALLLGFAGFAEREIVQAAHNLAAALEKLRR